MSDQREAPCLQGPGARWAQASWGRGGKGRRAVLPASPPSATSCLGSPGQGNTCKRQNARGEAGWGGLSRYVSA